MKRTLLFSTVIFSLTPALASGVNSWEVDALHGQIKVMGEMTEAPCSLDVATSARQEISLGVIPSYLLRKPGDRATPIPFQLQFRNCIRTKSKVTDVRTDSPTWDAMQPAVTVSFVAVADKHFPQMLSVNGVSGVALEVTDQQGADIRLGSRGRPQLLESPKGSLFYLVTPVRTPEKLTEGNFSAVMDFKVDYD